MTIRRRNFLKSAALLSVPGIPAVGFGGTCTDDATLLNLGLKKQLFFDDLLIESVQDITREFHQPRKYEGNPLIVKDKPWEHVFLFRTSSYSVLQDPKDKLFKCWYTDEGFTNEILRDFKGYSTGPVYRDLYAYSEDGIHWVKPQLGIYRENGQDTNICWGDQQSGGAEAPVTLSLIPLSRMSQSVSRASIPCSCEAMNGSKATSEGQAIKCPTQPMGCTGTHTTKLPSFGKFGPHLGDVTILSYDLDSKSYILTTRHPDNGR